MRKRIHELGLTLVVGLAVVQLFDALSLLADYRAHERREAEAARIRADMLERELLERSVAFEPDTGAGDAPPA